MTSRLELLRAALSETQAALSKAPYMFQLESAIAQLQYLIDLENGQRTDREKLSTINIGSIAAREIEGFDDALAERLHDVSHEVGRMEREG